MSTLRHVREIGDRFLAMEYTKGGALALFDWIKGHDGFASFSVDNEQKVKFTFHEGFEIDPVAAKPGDFLMWNKSTGNVYATPWDAFKKHYEADTESKPQRPLPTPEPEPQATPADPPGSGLLGAAAGAITG